tara:strand:- start:128 stop:445 length:318 start_codon:yes stop_codon:yes gene_type:complete
MVLPFDALPRFVNDLKAVPPFLDAQFQFINELKLAASQVPKKPGDRDRLELCTKICAKFPKGVTARTGNLLQGLKSHKGLRDDTTAALLSHVDSLEKEWLNARFA